MKIALLATAALLGCATLGARAAEEYPTPIARPVTSSIPTGDVGSTGYNAGTGLAVTMHNSGYTAATAIDGFPKVRPDQPAVAASGAGQHHS